MKKLLLLVAMVAVGFTANAQKNVVKVNPLGLVFGAAEFSYERAVSDKGAFEVSLAYTSFDVTSGSSKVDASGFGAEGKYKFYFSSDKDAPRGWYAAPFASYTSASYESGDSDSSVSTFGVGALAGYQWVFGGGDSGFSLDLNFGAGYMSADVDGDATASIDGFLPRLGLGIGYAW